MKIVTNRYSVGIFVATLFLAGVARADWLDGWKFRRSLTIDSSQIDADLTDFPLMVRVTPGVIDFSQARPDRFDIRFTADDGVTLLDYEREEYDPLNSKEIYWVRIPLISSTTDTSLFIYYGNKKAVDVEDPAAVWDDNHMAVWHLNQDNSGLQVDSTSHGRHLTVFGGVVEGEAGMIGNAVSFGGSDGKEEYLMTTDQPYPSVDVTEGITYSAWAFSTNNANSTIIASGGGNWSPYRITYMGRDGTTLRCNSSGGGGRSHDSWGITSGGFSKDAWHHVAMTLYYDPQADESALLLYINGELVNSNIKEDVETLRNPFSGHPFVVGARNHHAAADTRIFFNGRIDEARISNTRRSEAWLAASYRSQKPDSTLVAMGEIESKLEWYRGWEERRLITIDHTLIEAELTNFPVLVRLDEQNFDFTKARSDGHDIRFTADDGLAMLPYEREMHDHAEQRGLYWVLLPLISSTVDTSFYLYYGNAGSSDGSHASTPWDSHYMGVWHLAGKNTIQPDSTVYARHLTAFGDVARDEPGVVGGGIGLEGSADDPQYLLTAGPPYPEFGTFAGLTFSAWAHPTNEASGPAHRPLTVLDIGGGNWGTPYWAYYFGYHRNNMSFYASGSTGYSNFGATGKQANGFIRDRWNHVAATLYHDESIDETTMKLYVDGEEIDSHTVEGQALRNPLTGRPVVVGALTQSSWPNNNPEAYYNGWIDEARVSNIERSAAWIQVSYLNQKTGSEMLTFGKTEHERKGSILFIR